MKIAIVYDSGYGHTAKQAEAVAEGVRRVADAQALLIKVAEGDTPWETLASSDAIIFGSPTYNGSLSSRLKKFMEDSTRPAWLPLAWRDKVAAGFTNSGAQSGDKLGSLIAMALFAAQHGMIWAGVDMMPGRSADEMNRLGGWLGAMAQSDDVSPDLSPIASDLQTAAHLGERVARLAGRLKQTA
ncbi:flavodoxin family protein [Paraburkholderia bannensis]|uniref:flavodoxin family protein n=1 Tax=Paraburkholderia bannensis TaxID=765414 RepID=UPI002AB6D689|nr:flavodoxin family protein [Paraburkholderia bannensis]